MVHYCEKLMGVHCPSKCLLWVKKCCHICLDQNFNPSLLTSKLWLVFMRKKQKKNFFFEKNTKNAFFVCFWSYVRQPHGHIGWATLMPFASINSTNPRTNLWNFREKILRIGDFEKRCFFESAILNFFFRKKNFFLLFSHENKSKFTG